MTADTRVRAVLVDLLMATMDSMRTWADAAGGRDAGLAWRDAVTDRMIRSGRYRPYGELVVEGAAEVGLDDEAAGRLEGAWRAMKPWPDAGALRTLSVPYAFVTNCSWRLASLAVERSGLDPAFTLTAEDAGWYKPRSEIYLQACGRIRTDPANTRFVAGAAYDADGASASGFGARLIVRRAGAPVPRASIEVVSSMQDALDGVA